MVCVCVCKSMFLFIYMIAVFLSFLDDFNVSSGLRTMGKKKADSVKNKPKMRRCLFNFEFELYQNTLVFK